MVDAAADTGPHSGWWHCAALSPTGALSWYAVVDGGLHPDGERVELPDDEATRIVGERAVCTAHFTDGSVDALLHVGGVSPDAPPLWFADLPEAGGTPPGANLVAFSGHGIEPGRLLDRAELRSVGISSADQLAALRWYPQTGEIDQVYVQPARRREGIASVLLVAGGTLNRARGLPRFWSDGQRTALGDRLRNTPRFERFGADLTHLAPPMTPFDQR